MCLLERSIFSFEKTHTAVCMDITIIGQLRK
jgi:hypothetical protein